MAFKQNPIINDSSLLAMLSSSSSSAPPRLLPGLYEYPSIAGPGKSFYTLVERPHSHSQIMNNYEGGPDLDEFLVLDVENHDGAIKRGGGGLIAEKKRRLTRDQVRSLESSFNVERKLEPERKNQLALKLGLHPRQVAVWFQNRRARCKTKQLEHDYDRLKQQYDTLLADTTKLQSEVARLKELLQQKSDDGNHHKEAGSAGNNASNNRERQHLEEQEHYESDRILDEEVSSEEEMVMIMKEHHRHHFHHADDMGSFPLMARHNHHHNNYRHHHGHEQHEHYPFNISSKEE